MNKAIVCVGLAGCLFSPLQASAADKAATGRAVLIEAEKLKWADVPGFPGLQTSVVEGDLNKGPHHMFLKYKAGFAAPVHHHSPDHFVTVVAGTLVLTVDGKEHRLAPGSYFSFRRGAPHATICEPAADCVIFLDVRGKWDVVLDGKK